MAYLIFDTEEEAKQCSRKAWEQCLGRPKSAEDVTEFLWGWNTGKDGRSALIVPDSKVLWNVTQQKADAVTFTAEEQAATVSDLPDGKDENWEVDIGELQSKTRPQGVQEK